jgi:hypothetical protein
VRDIIWLPSVALRVVTAVHRFDWRLVRNELPNKWIPAEKFHAMVKTHIFGRIYVCFTSPDRVKGLYQVCAGQLNYLGYKM